MIFKIFTKLVDVFVLSLLLMKVGWAEDIELVGSLNHQLKQKNYLTHNYSKQAIQLLHVKLSDKEKNYLTSKAQAVLKHQGEFSQEKLNSIILDLPEKILLGMTNVPVLNQGKHGTCVTFALTAAIDAILSRGDYISQLCSLQLGSYLAKQNGSSSGWNGTHPITVINQITQYGIMTKAKQKSLGCGGMTRYPLGNDPLTDSFIEPDKFQSNNELIFGKLVNWSDIFQKNDSAKSLAEVKEALKSKDRLIFTVLLPREDLGIAGAVGKYKTWLAKDSWVLTTAILNGIKNIKVAHEMIITGYDDNAVAVDNLGAKHKGLLKLRNSWGIIFGNYGDFYMSYDYFKLLAYEVTRISPYSI
ncbi:MAG: C1 family peptidase [Tatlockia sp.]|nr:C1 family peptidase [Tatlockia sp.]